MHARTLALVSAASGAGELAGTRVEVNYHSADSSTRREHWSNYADTGFSVMKFGGARRG